MTMTMMQTLPLPFLGPELTTECFDRQRITAEYKIIEDMQTTRRGDASSALSQNNKKTFYQVRFSTVCGANRFKILIIPCLKASR